MFLATPSAAWNRCEISGILTKVIIKIIMKKILIIILALVVILICAFVVWNFIKIKPLMVNDIVEASYDNLSSYVGLGFEKESKKFYSLGELNKGYENMPWKDNNNFVDDKKYPLMVSVSNQDGTVPEQTLSIVYDKEETINVYLPALSGQGLPWAYFFVSEDGSTYWACATKQPCDVGTLSSSNALKKENIARKAP